MDNNTHMIARAEHERMVRSLPQVSEYDDFEPERKSIKSRLSVLTLRPILTAILHLVTK